MSALLSITAGAPSASATEVLGEPTNDLDTDTLAAVEDLLDGWPGTLVVVSHDRYLLERVTDRQVALLGDGSVRDLPGGVEEYLRLRADAASAQPGDAPPPVPVTSEAGEPSAAEVRTARKEVARLERRLDKLAAQEAELHAQLAQQATDHAAVLALDTQLRELAAERSSVEDAWLAAAETAG